MGVERGIEELIRIERADEMLREDANREVREKGRVRLLELELDRLGIARGDDDALHELRELRVALEAGIGDRVVGEEHIFGCERLAVVPGDATPKVEGVALTVAGDLPSFGEVGLRRAVRREADEAAEDQRAEIAVGAVGAGEERVDALRSARDALDVATAARGHRFATGIGEHEVPEDADRRDADDQGNEIGPSSLRQRHLNSPLGAAWSS